MRTKVTERSICRALILLAALLLVSVRPLLAEWELTGDLDGAEVVFDILEASDGTLYAATYPGGKVFVSFDEGESWGETAPLPTAIIAHSLAERPDSAIVAGTFPRGDLYVTSDHGVTWGWREGPPAGVATEIRSLLQSSSGDLFAGCAPYGFIFRSSDGGAEWELSHDVPDAIVPWCLVEGPPGTLWAGTTRGTGIYRSTDSGESWNPTGIFHRGETIYTNPCIATILPDAGGGALYAGMIHKGHDSVGAVFRSNDEGESWEELTGLPFCHGVWALARTSDGAIWAGLSTREEQIAYRSFDGGGSWWTTGPLEGAREVFVLCETSGGHLLAGTAPNGDIFRYDVAAAVEEEETGRLVNHRLSIDPNPILRSTTFSLRMLDGGRTELKIYDLSGRRVCTVLDRSLEAGVHSVAWDGADHGGSRLPAGVYFSVLRQGETVVTRKLVLLAR